MKLFRKPAPRPRFAGSAGAPWAESSFTQQTWDRARAASLRWAVAGALVDINLGDEKGWPVADALAERGIPFAFTSGGGDVIPADHAHRKLVTKPFRIGDIEAAIEEFGA